MTIGIPLGHSVLLVMPWAHLQHKALDDLIARDKLMCQIQTSEGFTNLMPFKMTFCDFRIGN